MYSREGGRRLAAETKTAGESPRGRSSFVAPLKRPGRGINADSLACHARHRERDAPPVRCRSAVLRLALAQASLSIGRAQHLLLRAGEPPGDGAAISALPSLIDRGRAQLPRPLAASS